jgi:hypothetical protein
MSAPIGQSLELTLQAARNEVVLAAPFIKYPVVQRLIDTLQPGVHLTIITRWRPIEVAAGVTDLKVLDLVSTRPQSSLAVCDRLHAKYYRADERVLIGSANLTATALGWAPVSNLELLVEVTGVLEEPRSIEEVWLEESVPATEEMRDTVQAAADALALPEPLRRDDRRGDEDLGEIGAGIQVVAPLSSWLPALRHPDSLYDVYANRTDRLSTDAYALGKTDLATLQVPRGLSAGQLRTYVRARLLQVPLIYRIDDFALVPRRFGEISDLIASRTGGATANRAPDEAWQTLMRWLLYFRPERYRVSRPRHSELFERIDGLARHQ